MTKRTLSLTLLLCLVACGSALAETKDYVVTVAASDNDYANVPLRALLTLPAEWTDAHVASLTCSEGKSLAGQLASPSLFAESASTDASRQLHFVLPRIDRGQTLRLTAKIAQGKRPVSKTPAFQWHDTSGKNAELRLGGRPVMRYMYEALDESTKERRGETYKVYHHVFDPLGERLVTKGPGGLFPHHRGLFFGFNRISYDGGRADTWHCGGGESQSHEQFVSQTVGPVLGRHRVVVDWHGRDGSVFASEQRELAAFNVADGVLIEFATRLSSAVGPVKLDGDPQHAGFQFRASQHVPDKTKQLTYYVRPDGVGEPGKFRNWPGSKEHVDLPWNALSFVIDDQRYTCCYLDRPENPKQARFSERDYGRFGSYFEFELDEDRPLELNYRIWLQQGEMTVEQVEAQSRSFVSPPEVKVEEN